MDINERIEQRRAELAAERGAEHVAALAQDVERRRQEAEDRKRRAAIRDLVVTFADWAKQSRIRPVKLDRPGRLPTKRGWEIADAVANNSETHNGHPNRKFLRLFTDGTAEWYDATGFGSVVSTTADALEYYIVDYIAESSSTVPWPG